MSYTGRMQSAFRKPPSVIAFKLIQLLRLWFTESFGIWRAICRKAQKWANYNSASISRFVILADDADLAVKDYTAKAPEDVARLITLGEDILKRKLEVLGVPLEPDTPWPWHEDWRFGKTWPPQPFKKYNFYEPRQQPYDVKFPWELSRLAIVVLLLQASVLKPSSRFVEEALAILTDWQDKNPLAHSVNWVPMEASMRTINLVFALELCQFLRDDFRNVAEQLRERIVGLLISHGEFIWRTREYTDVPGNHYSANLVALLLLGVHFQNSYGPARRWRRLALRSIPVQIERQFTADGVNFEKSVAYHRLVTELFVLAMLVMDRIGHPLNMSLKNRLRQAAHYALNCRRPDGWGVNVGDNDDAQALPFDARHPRDHAALINLCGVYFADPSLLMGGITAVWLMGRKANGVVAAPIDYRTPSVRHFEEGGVAVWRRGQDYLWVDVGEVGQNGLGGHGHNDLLSFELALDGQPVIIDPGTYLYTGDLAARRWFRGTSAHNTITVDGEELAPLLGHWRIANTAKPFDVRCADNDGRLLIGAAHTGFLRLADPVSHERIFKIENNNFTLIIEDVLRCSARHKIDRRLHFSPRAVIELGQAGCIVKVGLVKCKLSWAESTQASLETGWVSEVYAQRSEASVLVLDNWIQGDTKLSLVIDKLRGSA